MSRTTWFSPERAALMCAAGLVTAINGRTSMFSANVKQSPPPDPIMLPATSNAGVIHRTETFLTADAHLCIASSGTWLRGFGEFIEENDREKRRLRIGGVLLNLPPGTKSRIQTLIDDTRKLINADLASGRPSRAS